MESFVNNLIIPSLMILYDWPAFKPERKWKRCKNLMKTNCCLLEENGFSWWEKLSVKLSQNHIRERSFSLIRPSGQKWLTLSYMGGTLFFDIGSWPNNDVQSPENIQFFLGTTRTFQNFYDKTVNHGIHGPFKF